jgi:organic radical activating enzyme
MKKSGLTVDRQSTEELAGLTAVNGWAYHDESTKQFPLSENPFPFVFVDLTYRCNMKCNICYNPVRPMPDMTLDYFTECIRQLPNPVEIRMLGGEPSIHPQFFDFVKTAFDFGHDVYVSSNGKVAAKDLNWCRELKSIERSSKNKLKMHMDMSGGKAEPGFAGEDNKFYHIIHGEPCYDEKVQALRNYAEANIGRTTISAILVRNLNESVIPDMFSIADDHQKVVREVAFRSQGRIGRYVGNEEPYKTNDWIKLMMDSGAMSRADMSQVIMAGFMSKNCKGKNCCFHYKPNMRLSVSWLDFLADTCWLRGQIVEGTSNVEYMFESLQANDFNKLPLDHSKEEEYDQKIRAAQNIK